MRPGKQHPEAYLLGEAEAGVRVGDGVIPAASREADARRLVVVDRQVRDVAQLLVCSPSLFQAVACLVEAIELLERHREEDLGRPAQTCAGRGWCALERPLCVTERLVEVPPHPGYVG